MTDETRDGLVERLRAASEMKGFTTLKEIGEAAAALDAAEAKVLELREALEPFAKIGLWRDSYPDAKCDHAMLTGIDSNDIRRAREALASTGAAVHEQSAKEKNDG